MSRESSVEEIRERLEAVTDGPWKACCTWDPMLRPHVQLAEVDELVGCSGRYDIPQTEDDADFIAHAPTDIAYLLEIAEAAREVVAERDDLGMAVEDEDGLWDAIDRLRDALEAENE